MSPEKQILKIIQKLSNLGPMLPGSISEQWNVCGNKTCACKNPENPVKHGPYYQLSFSVKGKSSSMFVKKEDLSEAQRRIKNYKEFKELSFQLVQAYVDLARKNGLERSSSND